MNVSYWNIHRNKFVQTTDGTNDFYLGDDGVNGFSITPFTGRASMCFNIIINLPSTINSSSASSRLFEISNTARTSLYSFDIGAYTGSLTGEFIGAFRSLAGATRVTGCTTGGGSIAAGWHMLTVRQGATAQILVDGVALAMTNGASGAITDATFSFTPTRAALMAATSGVVPTGCDWREALFLNSSFSDAGILALYNYYTSNGAVPLGNSNKSAVKFFGTTSGRAQVIALYRGQESGTDLLDYIATASDLTKTNF